MVFLGIIPLGSYDGIIRIHDIRISFKQPGFPMESIRVFFRKLHLFPVFILVLGRGGKVFGKSLATLKTYIEEPTEKIRKQKNPWTFFFRIWFQWFLSLFFFESVIQRCAAESIHLSRSWMHWPRLIFVYLFDHSFLNTFTSSLLYQMFIYI